MQVHGGVRASQQQRSNAGFEVVPASDSDSDGSDAELDNLDTRVCPPRQLCSSTESVTQSSDEDTNLSPKLSDC